MLEAKTAQIFKSLCASSWPCY